MSSITERCDRVRHRTWSANPAELSGGLSAPLLADAGTPFSRSGPERSYSTLVHGKQLTIPGRPQRSTGELLLLGDDGDDRFVVGVGGARAVNKSRTLLQRQEPSGELGLEPGTAR